MVHCTSNGYHKYSSEGHSNIYFMQRVNTNIRDKKKQITTQQR